MGMHRPATPRKCIWTRRNLTEDQLADIMHLPWPYGSGMAMARKYGVSRSMISMLRRGYRYHSPGDDGVTYQVRITVDNERYSLGAFKTLEAAQHAMDEFKLRKKWPRGTVYLDKRLGKWRARLSIGHWDTRREAERICNEACEALRLFAEEVNKRTATKVARR